MSLGAEQRATACRAKRKRLRSARARQPFFAWCKLEGMPLDTPEEDPRPLSVKIVGGAAVPSELPRSRLRQDVLLVVLSVVLSGAVAFGVARYTVDHDNSIQHRIAVQQQLSVVYLPLRLALAGVIACIAPNHCSEGEFLQANRAANKAEVAALGQGSATVDDLTSALDTTLHTVVANRLLGKRSSTALLSLASRQSVALNMQISKELGR